jgi:methylenetetrahydrofolate dehydrogenase (NADP+) / methenyltetrahydrofolate cyclohydrolase
MEQTILYGKPVADAIRRQLKEKFAGRDLTLATFLVGDNPAAKVYKRSLLKTAASLGVKTRDVELPEATSQEEAEIRLRELSEDPAITGILPLMPLPRHISKLDLIQQLDPEKDMDCVHPMNSGRLYLGITPWGPCTPRACMAILDHYGIPPGR